METKTILQKTTEDRTHYYLRAIRNRYVIYRLRANGNFGKKLMEAEFTEVIKEFKDEEEAVKFFQKNCV